MSKPLPFSSLPPYPSLDPTPGRQRLEPFLTPILNETQTLISTTIPQQFRPDRKLRSSASSTAKVQVLTSSPGSGVEDYWVCRKSIHADSAVKGSASWTEFERGLRENHSENEMEYTPSVASVENLVRWPVIEGLEGWKGIDMHVNMITHTFKPAGLISPRTFISLVISAYEPETSGNEDNDNPIQGFYTIQIPLLFQKDAPNNDVPDAIKQQILSVAPKNTIFAHYASVERVRLLPPVAGNGDGNRRIEWIMATTSDAGGLIPQWVQRSWTMGGVPKAIVADVGLFLGWVDKKRS
ncbi:conserved hypothetical protein [Talaromyces stipitatus ATCC 10500]|uniref:DUF3074 domain-containing protein n=1 Tax=Talaromyces stipitatus (strain ATCC 10500 / CBS 375.48 / QM 6759 / NRRL 1006) TaxID=441959 RepID=B8LZF6_TALSN|nr:uncharacterized protein TSTA_089460 [Talaromyces stipitatus ATCC 10500]EED21709.1 conserved hypothetical protein [Talaromyces stipitatus ATCC 10500]